MATLTTTLTAMMTTALTAMMRYRPAFVSFYVNFFNHGKSSKKIDYLP
jgi:hypothetical protein